MAKSIVIVSVIAIKKIHNDLAFITTQKIELNIQNFGLSIKNSEQSIIVLTLENSFLKKFGNVDAIRANVSNMIKNFSSCDKKNYQRNDHLRNLSS